MVKKHHSIIDGKTVEVHWHLYAYCFFFGFISVCGVFEFDASVLLRSQLM